MVSVLTPQVALRRVKIKRSNIAEYVDPRVTSRFLVVGADLLMIFAMF